MQDVKGITTLGILSYEDFSSTASECLYCMTFNLCFYWMNWHPFELCEHFDISQRLKSFCVLRSLESIPPVVSLAAWFWTLSELLWSLSLLLCNWLLCHIASAFHEVPVNLLIRLKWSFALASTLSIWVIFGT